MDRFEVGRRAFLQAGAASTAAASAAGRAVSVREKFFGCIAGCHIGSAMAAPVEGWTWEKIQAEYGTLERLLPYEHYRNGWRREPGTTEDGVERQKLMITAILEKQDRVNAEDVRAVWLRDIRHPGMVSEPFEATLLAMARSGIPACDIGKYCDYAGLISLARSCHPIGLINAGDERHAIEDVRNVGQLYHTANSRAIRWAEVTVTGIAAACRPGATVESVLEAIVTHCAKDVVAEIQRGLKLAAGCRDFRELRQAFDSVYSGRGIPYASSYANEVVTKAIAIFRMTGGNVWDALKAGVNMGRDTDCCTAVAAGISGALGGGGPIPGELIRQVDRAVTLNPYTNSQRTLRETGDGLHAAFQARLERLKRYAAEMV